MDRGLEGMKSGILKKIMGILVIVFIIAAMGYTWYDGGMQMVDKEISKVEEITIYNSIYMLEEGAVIRQRFIPQQDYLNAVELMLVNTTKQSEGDLVVQVLDMWGEVLKENRYPLAEIEAGAYKRIDVNAEMPVVENEEYQICVYQTGADEIPGIVTVPYESGVTENGICFLGEEIIEGNGLAVGYIYGERAFVGYEYQGRSNITMLLIKTVVILLLGAVLLALVYFFDLQVVKGYLFSYKIFSQISMITALFAGFFLSAVINKCVADIKIPGWVYLFFVLTALVLFWTLCLYMKRENRKGRKRLKKTDKQCILLLSAVSVLIRLPMFTHMQRWDGGFYYTHLHNACIHFDFTWQSVWDYFRLAQHPTLSYSLIMLIGEFLFPGKVTGVLFVQLILTVAGIVCIYLLFRHYWCHMASVPAMLLTFLISVTPLFLGTFSYINVDYTLLIFFVFMLYAVSKRKLILVIFWTIAVMLNKETGWAIIAGYYLGYFAGTWFEEKNEGFKEKLKRLGKNKMLYIILASGLVLGFYMIRQEGISGWFSYGKYSSFFASRADILKMGMEVNAIGIYPAYIFYRLGEMFLLNFMWVPTVIILASVILLIRNKGKMWGKGIANLWGMLGSLVTFVLFNCLYITYALVRYTVFSSVVWWILAVLLLYYVIAPYLNERILTIGLGTAAVLLLIQNVCYIDPVSNLLYDRLDSGKGKILCVNMETDYYGDAIVTNYRFNYLDSLLDKLLTEIDYDGSTCIFQCMGDEGQIAGIGAYPCGWDYEQKERRYLSEETIRRYGELIPINTWYLKENAKLSKEKEGLPQNAVAYFLSYDGLLEEKYLKMLSPYYRIGERTKISNWGGCLYYYTLEKI